MKLAIIKIKNLKLKAIVGINPPERIHKQEIVINVAIELDASKAIKTDDIKHAMDYKTITKKIIAEVEKSSFFLLEALADFVLQLIMSHKQVKKATVEVDKPLALRFADSVSVTVSAKRSYGHDSH